MPSLFPKILQDKSNLALEKIINSVFKFDLKPLIYLFIDDCEERFLKILAESFHVMGDEGWNHCQSLKEKRELIKESLLIHKYKGTKAALKRVLKVVNVSGEINEWFEYGARPMYFKVLLNVFDKELSLETELKLITLINEFKNERSRLESIDIYLNETANMYIYSNIISGLTISIGVIQ